MTFAMKRRAASQGFTRPPLELRRVTEHKDIKSLDRYYQPHTEDLAAKAIAYENRNSADKE